MHLSKTVNTIWYCNTVESLTSVQATARTDIITAQLPGETQGEAAIVSLGKRHTNIRELVKSHSLHCHQVTNCL